MQPRLGGTCESNFNMNARTLPRAYYTAPNDLTSSHNASWFVFQQTHTQSFTWCKRKCHSSEHATFFYCFITQLWYSHAQFKHSLGCTGVSLGTPTGKQIRRRTHSKLWCTVLTPFHHLQTNETWDVQDSVFGLLVVLPWTTSTAFQKDLFWRGSDLIMIWTMTVWPF